MEQQRPKDVVVLLVLWECMMLQQFLKFIQRNNKAKENYWHLEKKRKDNFNFHNDSKMQQCALLSTSNQLEENTYSYYIQPLWQNFQIWIPFWLCEHWVIESTRKNRSILRWKLGSFSNFRMSSSTTCKETRLVISELQNHAALHCKLSRMSKKKKKNLSMILMKLRWWLYRKLFRFIHVHTMIY